MKHVQQLCLCTPTKGFKMKHKNGSRLSAVKHNEGSKIQTQIILFETLAYIKSTHKCNISLI